MYDTGGWKVSGLGSGINADPEHKPKHPLVVIYAANISSARDKVISFGAALAVLTFDHLEGL
jgi:hypothetical protein